MDLSILLRLTYPVKLEHRQWRKYNILIDNSPAISKQHLGVDTYYLPGAGGITGKSIYRKRIIFTDLTKSGVDNRTKYNPLGTTLPLRSLP